MGERTRLFDADKSSRSSSSTYTYTPFFIPLATLSDSASHESYGCATTTCKRQRWPEEPTMITNVVRKGESRLAEWDRHTSGKSFPVPSSATNSWTENISIVADRLTSVHVFVVRTFKEISRATHSYIGQLSAGDSSHLITGTLCSLGHGFTTFPHVLLGEITRKNKANGSLSFTFLWTSCAPSWPFARTCLSHLNS
jgi:hypothetical protein